MYYRATCCIVLKWLVCTVCQDILAEHSRVLVLKCLTAEAALACPAGRALTMEASVGVDVREEGYLVCYVALEAGFRLPAA